MLTNVMPFSTFHSVFVTTRSVFLQQSGHILFLKLRDLRCMMMALLFPTIGLHTSKTFLCTVLPK